MTTQSTALDIYLPQMAQVTDVRQMTEREKYFKVFLINRLNHKPGQFVMAGVFGVGEAPISISCSPEDDFLEMVIRKTGRLTTIFHNLDVGDRIGIRGPYGSGFDLDTFKGKDILFIAGGLGLAPLRSLIKPIMNHKSHYGHVTLISGCRNPSEELYRDDLTQWARIQDVDVIRTVDDAANMPWKGRTGLVTAHIPKLSLNPANTVAVLCGPPVMYKFTIMSLDMKGIPHDQVYVDLERRMKCGVGKCGHCQINDLVCCQDGPVFRFSDIKYLKEAFR